MKFITSAIKVGRIRMTMIEKQSNKKFRVPTILLLLIFCLLISACDALKSYSDFFPENSVRPQETGSDEPVSIETIEPTSIPTQVPIDYDVITIWTQPIFNPDENNPASENLKTHLQEYLNENPGVKIKFRLKEADGSKSILHDLSLTADAAPSALPTIVLLTRDDMERAASLGLIRPINVFTDVLENNDWYPFAKKMGVFKNEVYGLPFAADAMALFTKSENYIGDYLSLSSLPIRFGEIGFVAGNPDSLLPYLLYQSAGGKLIDESDQPILEEENLSVIFTTIADSKKLNNPTPSLNQYPTEDELWEAFNAGDIGNVISWSSKVFANSNDYNMTYIPTIGNVPYTYADGWVWCLVQKETADIERNIDFMQYMVTPEFLNEWTSKTSYLPVRPSTTKSFESKQYFLDDLLLSADIIPAGAVRKTSELILSESITALLNREITPEVGVQNVLAKLEESQQSE